MKNLMPPARHCRGFTLIELTVVTGIIAILGALALPSYRDFIESARTAEALVLYDAMREDVQILSQSAGLDPCNWQFTRDNKNMEDSQTLYIRDKINTRLSYELKRNLFFSVLTKFAQPTSAYATSTSAPLMVQFGGVGAMQIARTRLLAEEFKRIGKFNRWERETKTFVAFTVFLGNCAKKP